ncbi:hypothetical protein HCC18_13065 [Listeria booriae]|uniref:hypothetical protein n=1 Tax=Listeria booriae TaxID=1552123 RepID=UPI00162ABF7B|nr:hypothetical protein [Listeria booriae]MBC2317770.1 hypothetical protein [Listeria booriae]
MAEAQMKISIKNYDVQVEVLQNEIRLLEEHEEYLYLEKIRYKKILDDFNFRIEGSRQNLSNLDNYRALNHVKGYQGEMSALLTGNRYANALYGIEAIINKLDSNYLEVKHIIDNKRHEIYNIQNTIDNLHYQLRRLGD